MRSKRIYSPEEVTRRLRKGFFLSCWGVDFMIGSVPLMLLVGCRVPEAVQMLAPIVSFVLGLILLIIGRAKVGRTTRYLGSSCNRKCTPAEEFVLGRLHGTEDCARDADVRNISSKMIPGVTDDMAATLNSGRVISGFRQIGHIYTGQNIFINHWPIICMAMIVAVCFIAKH